MGNTNWLKAHNIIKRELADLDVPVNSAAYKAAYDNALSASEVMGDKELKTYIEEYIENLSILYF